MKRGFQSATAHPEQPQRHTDVVARLDDLLTETAAARLCKYFDRGCTHPVRAFQQWARRKGIPVKVVARQRLYDPRVLEAFLDREAWTRRHAPKASPRQLVAVR